MSGLKYQMSHVVKGYECDFQGEMALPALINIMVHVSGLQSDSLGNTEARMMEQGFSWVIIQYHIQVDRLPQRKEQITLETKALSYNRFFTYRAFRARDTAGNKLVEVLATFSVMDLQTRKLARVQESMVAPYQAEEIRSIVRQPKPSLPAEENKSEQLFRVRYLDIDGNRHVNNSKYFDWMINTLDIEFLTTHRVQEVNIKYEKEVEYGTVIHSEVSVHDQEDGRILTAHQIVNGDVTACTANLFWVEKN